MSDIPRVQPSGESKSCREDDLYRASRLAGEVIDAADVNASSLVEVGLDCVGSWQRGGLQLKFEKWKATGGLQEASPFLGHGELELDEFFTMSGSVQRLNHSRNSSAP